MFDYLAIIRLIRLIRFIRFISHISRISQISRISHIKKNKVFAGHKSSARLKKSSALSAPLREIIFSLCVRFSSENLFSLCVALRSLREAFLMRLFF